MSKINIELVTPEELILSEDADLVVVPGSEGDFGVLYNHSPMISTIRPGVVTVESGEKAKRELFVSGGFAEVTGGRCTILVEEAVDVKSLKPGELEKLISEAANA